MNLALLNPFRQADRIDSTLTIPRSLHPPRPKPDLSTKTTQTTSSDVATTDDSSSKKSDNKDKVTNTNTSTTSTTQTTTATSNDGDTPINTSTTAAKKPINTEQQNKEPSQNETGDTSIKPSLPEEKEVSTSTSMDIDTKESNISTATSTMDNIEMKDSNLSEKSTTLEPPTKEKPLTQKKKRKKKSKGQSFDESDSDDDEDNTYWTACYTVSFNRRGSLLSSGHASGLIPIHDFLGRTMSALYYPPPPIRLTKSMNNGGSLVTPSIREGGSLLTSFMYEINANKKKRKGWSKKKPPQLPTNTKNKNDDNVEQHEVTAAVSGDGTLDNKQDVNKEEESDSQVQYVNGVTSLSWDRRSRTLLAGAIGDKNLRLMDNTHPLVSTDCTDAVKRQYLEEHSSKEVIKKIEKMQTTFEEKKTKVTSRSPPVMVELNTPDNGNIPIQIKTVSIGRARLLKSKILDINTTPKQSLMKQISSTAVVDKMEIINIPARRYSTLLLELPQPLGGPLQLHPNDDSHTGLACMIDGSLGLFLIPHLAYYETLTSTDTGIAEVDERKKSVMKLLKDEDLCRVGTLGYIVPPPRASNPNYFITCAAFGKHGDVIWAVTKCGNLLAYAVDQSMIDVLRGDGDVTSPTAIEFVNQKIKPKLCFKVPGSAAAWQIIISRNGKHLLINSADCSLRLYSIEELTGAFDKDCTDDIEPCFSFQDNITKCPWASCDFSGDGEYVIGGCNSYPQPGDNYKIFLWSTHTGELADQLTGPVSSLYSLSCHPTRPFIAVGTCDGIIDVWGTRLDWSAFAPNFQRLQQNEVYEEAEDEFDIVVDGDDSSKGDSLNQASPEDDVVDITTVSKVPAFDSDSEEEEEIFHFDWRAERIVLPETRGRRDPVE